MAWSWIQRKTLVWLTYAIKEIPGAFCHKHKVQGSGYAGVCFSGLSSFVNPVLSSICNNLCSLWILQNCDISGQRPNLYKIAPCLLFFCPKTVIFCECVEEVEIVGDKEKCWLNDEINSSLGWIKFHIKKMVTSNLSNMLLVFHVKWLGIKISSSF